MNEAWRKSIICNKPLQAALHAGVVFTPPLTAKDRRTCQYVMRHIHKLPFGVPRGVKASEICELENIVSSFYREVKRSESSVLGYKGGHVEEDLLERLDIPCVNLERFGCLKAEELMKEMIWVEKLSAETTRQLTPTCIVPRWKLSRMLTGWRTMNCFIELLLLNCFIEQYFFNNIYQ